MVMLNTIRSIKRYPLTVFSALLLVVSFIFVSLLIAGTPYKSSNGHDKFCCTHENRMEQIIIRVIEEMDIHSPKDTIIREYLVDFLDDLHPPPDKK